jgi:Cu/Ag efflux protein CusF
VNATNAARRWGPWATVVLLGAVAGRHRADDSPNPSSQAVKRYTMRAEIVSLPERPGGYLTLRHEAIDDLTSESGAVVGMDSMVMPFPVAPGSSLKGMKVGDKIEAILEMDWSEGFFQLERIERLPPGTVLHFRKARPAAKTPPSSESTNQEKRP